MQKNCFESVYKLRCLSMIRKEHQFCIASVAVAATRGWWNNCPQIILLITNSIFIWRAALLLVLGTSC